MSGVEVQRSSDESFSASDTVCRGLVTADTPVSAEGATDADGRPLPTDYKVLLSPDWCYKGHVGGGQIEIRIRVSDPGWGRPLSPGAYVLAFLVKQGDSYLPLRPTGSFYAFWRGGESTQSSGNGLEKLQSDALQIASNTKDFEIARSALEFLLTFRALSSTLNDTLVTLSRSPNDDVRILALGARIKVRNGQELGSVLHEFAAELRGRGSVDSASSLILAQLTEVIELQTSEGDLDGLKDIVNCPVAHLRMTAMVAIRRLRVPSSVPFLIEQLGSADLAVQYQAVVSLAELTGKGGDFGPAMDKFEREPGRYRTMWLNWWTNEGSRRYPSRR